MHDLFQQSVAYEEYKNILCEPLDADKELHADKTYLHTQSVCFITDQKLMHINKVILLKDAIQSLFFVYADFGERKWDDRYWFFVGRLHTGIYFAYEADCSGTGFGLGTVSKVHFSKTPDALTTYGLTDKQRDLITNNIDRRFILICPNTICHIDTFDPSFGDLQPN